MTGTGGTATETTPQLEARVGDTVATDMRSHTARGTLLNSAFSVGFAGLGLIQRLVVAAFITQEQFGLWAVILTVLVTLAWLNQIGIADKFIQQNEPDQVSAFQKAFTLELLMSGAFFALVVIALPLYALAYGRSEIIVPGLIAALVVPLYALEAPAWIPYRQLDYLRHRILTSVDPLVTFIVTVALAIAGFGYWCFVIGVVAGAASGALVCLVTAKYPVRIRWDRQTARSYFSFSFPLFGSALSRLVIVQGSLLAANHAAGLAGIGAIGLATGIAMFAERVDGIVGQTLYPAVCAVSDRVTLMYEIFVKSNRIALMWGLSFGTALALFADDFVDFVLGPKWDNAAGLLAAIGLTTGIGQLAFNWDLFMRAVNDTKPIFMGAAWGFASFLFVSLPAILIWGTTGWAIGVAASQVILIVVRGHYLRRLFPQFRLLPHAARAVAPVLPGVAVVLVLRAGMTGDRTLLQAIGELLIYAAVTIAATALLERRLINEVVGYLRRRIPTARPA